MPEIAAVAGVAVQGAETAGMHRFTATLVPTQAGRLEIPAISISSFDPVEHGLKRLYRVGQFPFALQNTGAP